MPITLSKEDLIRIVKGKGVVSASKIQFSGAEFDSREIKGGELFVALKGATNHGHDFLPVAFERGASLALVEDPKLLSDPIYGERCVVVSDSLAAFSELANWWRKELKLKVLGITGSVGKTTVKEMAAAVLLRHSRGIYSLKSHNNHVGVPYTILRAGREHEWAVLEMGMNHAGELSQLSQIAEPDVVLITCIAPAHIGQLGSEEAIADAKLEILHGLKSGGAWILNGDDKVLNAAIERIPAKPVNQAIFFSSTSASEASVAKVETLGFEGISFELALGAERLACKMSIVGRHNALNAAAAVLGAKTLVPELSNDQILSGLSGFRAPHMRLNIHDLPGGAKLIDDSYNANPSSMCALLALASDLRGEGQKLGAILGDMLELGGYSEKYHREVGDAAVKAKLSFLIAVGKDAKFYLESARNSGIACFEAENPVVAAHIARKLGFDILLVKASRGIGLDRTVKTLTGEQ